MALENTIGWASAGAAIGGPWGAGIGGAIGLGMDILGGGNSAKARQLDAESQALGYQTAALQTGVQIQQTTSDISAYENFLTAFPNYAELTKRNFEAESRNQFNTLLQNYAGQSVIAGETGRVGGSAGLVAAEAQSELRDYAGTDEALGGEAMGRYGMGKSELDFNLTTQQNQATSQLGILKTSLGTLEETLGLYQNAQSSAESRAKQAEKAGKTWWNPFD